MDDTSYISRVLDGEEVTLGRWRVARPLRRSRNRLHSHRHDGRDDSDGRRGQRRRPASRGSSRRRRDPEVPNGRERNTPQRGGRRHDVLREWEQQRGVVTFGENPLLQNEEFQSFLTVVRSQCLMMFGDTREYACCLDVLRPAQLARSTMDVTSLKQHLYRRATDVAALSWLLLSPGFTGFLPREWIIDMAPEEGFESTGHLAAWFVSLVLLLKSLEEVDGGRCIRRVTIRIQLDVHDRHLHVMSQGFEHVSIALKQMAQAEEPLLVSFEWVTLGSEPLSDAACNLRDLFSARVLQGVTEYKQVTDGQKLAFLMGLHARVGRRSLVQALSQDVIEKIFSTYEDNGLMVEFFSQSTKTSS